MAFLKKSTHLFIVFGLIAILLPACSGEESANGQSSEEETTEVKPQDKDFAVPDSEKQYAVDNIMTVSPGEALKAMDNLEEGGSIDWESLMAGSTKTDYESAYANSLNLGVRIADILVSVNQEDRIAIFNYWNSISGLSKNLGHEKRLQPIKEQLDQDVALGKWNKVRATLDEMYLDIENYIDFAQASKADQEQGALVAAGSWLEGISIISQHLKSNYDAENSDLLNQRLQLRQYLDEVKKLNIDAPLVNNVVEGMESTLRILGDDETAIISQSQVSQIADISSSLVEQILNAS
jgi:hypothetical protein